MHYIPIIDAGVALREGYGPFDDGVSQDIFLKTDDSSLFIGQVWADDAVFPDWFHPNASAWWSKWVSNFHD